MVDRVDIVVTERGARVVRRNIEDIGRATSQVGRATTVLQRQLGTLGRAGQALRPVANRFRELQNEARAATRSTSALGNALRLVGGAVAVRGLVNTADSVTNLRNRLSLVTESAQETEIIFDELLGVATRTRSDFNTTGQIFSRVALSLKEAGVSSQTLLDVTESLNQAVILSGTTSQEANNALIQLSQGLASGALRGDELRSVLEQLPFVADVIARQLGVTRGELRELGEQGLITARDIVTAFEEQREEIAEAFANTVPTIAQSINVLQTSFIGLVRVVDDATGASALLSTAILGIAENLEIILPIALTLVTLLAAPAIFRAVASLTVLATRVLPALSIAAGLATGAFGILTGVLGALAAAVVFLFTTPLGLLIVAITSLTTIFVTWREEIVAATRDIPILGVVVSTLAENIEATIAAIVAFTAVLALSAVPGVIAFFATLATRILPALAAAASIAAGAFGVLTGVITFLFATPLGALIVAITSVIVSFTAWREELVEVTREIPILSDVVQALAGFIDTVKDLVIDLGIALGLLEESVRGNTEAVKEASDANNRFADILNRVGDVAGTAGAAVKKASEENERANRRTRRTFRETNVVAQGVRDILQQVGQVGSTSFDRVTQSSGRAAAGVQSVAAAGDRAAASLSRAAAASERVSAAGPRVGTRGRGALAGTRGTFGPSGALQQLSNILGVGIQTRAGRTITGGFTIRRRLGAADIGQNPFEGLSREEAFERIAEAQRAIISGRVQSDVGIRDQLSALGVQASQLPGQEEVDRRREDRRSIFAGGFQRGGSFVVPGLGGGDRRLVTLAASAGERVNVETRRDREREDRGGRGGVFIESININLQGVTDASGFRRSSRQLGTQLRRSLTNVGNR